MAGSLQSSSPILVKVRRFETMELPDSARLDEQQGQNDDSNLELSSKSTSSIQTSITSLENATFDFMGGGNAINPKPKLRPKSVGRFLRTDENGWLTEKKRLDKVSPSGAVINGFLHDKEKYVG